MDEILVQELKEQLMDALGMDEDEADLVAGEYLGDM